VKNNGHISDVTKLGQIQRKFFANSSILMASWKHFQ